MNVFTDLEEVKALAREILFRRHAFRSGERVCLAEWDGYEHEHLGDARCPYCGAQA